MCHCPTGHCACWWQRADAFVMVRQPPVWHLKWLHRLLPHTIPAAIVTILISLACRLKHKRISVLPVGVSTDSQGSFQGHRALAAPWPAPQRNPFHGRSPLNRIGWMLTFTAHCSWPRLSLSVWMLFPCVSASNLPKDMLRCSAWPFVCHWWLVLVSCVAVNCWIPVVCF